MTEFQQCVAMMMVVMGFVLSSFGYVGTVPIEGVTSLENRVTTAGMLETCLSPKAKNPALKKGVNHEYDAHKNSVRCPGHDVGNYGHGKQCIESRP